MASKGKRKVNTAQIVDSAKTFMLYHCEKIAAAAVLVTAFWIVLTGFNYTGMTWGPDTIDKEVQAADSAIKASKYSAADAGLVIIDYAKLSESIKEPVNAEPYKTETAWNSPLLQPAAPREKIEVLAPEIAEAKAVREKLGFQVAITVKIPSEQQKKIFEDATRGKTQGAGTGQGNTVRYDASTYTVIIDRSDDGGKTWEEYINDSRRSTSTSKRNSSSTDRASNSSSKEYSYYSYADVDVTPETNYMYRATLVASNPNYGLSPGLVAQGVDTTNKTLNSDYSAMKSVLVPGQTRVEIAADTKAKPVKWTALADPFHALKIVTDICVFDDENAVDLSSLPMEISRGSVCDIAARDITGALKKLEKENLVTQQNRTGWEEFLVANKTGLESGICIVDISPEYELAKFPTAEGKTAPDITVPCKILLVSKNGHLSVQKTDPLKTAKAVVSGGGGGYPSSRDDRRRSDRSSSRSDREDREDR